MANTYKKARRAGDTSPAAGGVEVVNLAAMRAQRSQQPRYVTDQNGQRHYLNGLPLDSYLAMLEIEGMYREMAESGEAPDGAQQGALMQSMRDAISAALPEFPVGGLFFEELPVVFAALQNAVMPEQIKENGADAEPGKST